MIYTNIKPTGGCLIHPSIFSWHNKLPTEHCLNATAYLSILLTMSISYDYSVPSSDLLMATTSRIMHHVTKLKSSQAGFLNMTMSLLYSNGLHSHLISIQLEQLLWDVWNGRFASGCAADKSAETVWCYHVNMDQMEECFQHLVESCHEKWRQLWRQKGVPHPGTSKAYLIKWPVSV